MCLLGIAYQILPDCPVALLANREEFYGRPTDSPRVHPREGERRAWLGGQDLRAGGTWLGANEGGMVVAVTNRRKTNPPANPVSRGSLCRELLGLGDVAGAFAEGLRQLQSLPFAGCNLIVLDRHSGFIIEAGDTVVSKPLTPGIHCITNADADDPSDPRIRRARTVLESLGAPVPEIWIPEAMWLCGAGAEGQQPAICLEGSDRGTVSSSIITLPTDVGRSTYLYADGPPSRTPYRDDSPQFRKLLLGDSASVQKTAPNDGVHRIRLRGPWEFQPLARAEFHDHGRMTWHTDQLPAAGSAHFPTPWQSLFGEFRGRVRFRRRFHRPTNLDPDERVWLAFAAVGGTGEVTVNGFVLGTLETSRVPQLFEVTTLLKGDDELLVDLEFVGPPATTTLGGLFAPVQLEMHPGTPGYIA